MTIYFPQKKIYTYTKGKIHTPSVEENMDLDVNVYTKRKSSD